ncbi:MAG: hypothetical protein ABIJ41_02320 [Candidatus Omnitrophota bacterium]
MFGKKSNPELNKFAEYLTKGIKNLFGERGEIKFSKDPEIVKKDIIEYQGRMRTDGMEKFNSPTYVSFLNYFANKADMEKKKALGALVLYVEQNFMAPLMKKLKYPAVNDEDEEALKDSCGTLCNLIGGRFKSEISCQGYAELEMSHFYTYRNSASDGVAFCFSEYEKYEISFTIDNEKRVVVEMTMGIVPRR